MGRGKWDGIGDKKKEKSKDERIERKWKTKSILSASYSN